VCSPERRANRAPSPTRLKIWTRFVYILVSREWPFWGVLVDSAGQSGMKNRILMTKSTRRSWSGEKASSSRWSIGPLRCAEEQLNTR
jgi:hypothetical protein